ncbi:MAG: leucine-rich repeat domain-containing protein [Planctomycetaceae bacterium]
MPHDSHPPRAATGFSLWKGIGWTTAIVVGLWVAITAVQRYRMEKLRTEVESRGGRLEGEDLFPGWYIWLRTKTPNGWLAQTVRKLDHSFRRVVHVHVPPGTTLPPNFISRLTCFQQLTRLELSECQLTDADVASLSEFTKLKYLDLSKNPLSDRGLARLDKLVNLEVVVLNETRVGDQVLRQASRLPNLITLMLAGTLASDDGLKDLGTFPKLMVLILSGTRVSDLGLESLRPLPILRVLSVKECAITDRGLATIDDLRFPDMLHLDLSQTQVTADGVSRLHLGKLETLLFPKVAMTDEHWRGLLGMKHLQSIQWDDTVLSRDREPSISSGSRGTLDSFVTNFLFFNGRYIRLPVSQRFPKPATPTAP